MKLFQFERKLLSNKEYPMIASVRSYKPIALIINLAAIIRGLEPWSHTFYIYVHNNKVYYHEITFFHGVRNGLLSKKYLKKRYKGRLQVHIIPYKKVRQENFESYKRYSTTMAILSWLMGVFKVFRKKRQKDSSLSSYCSDKGLDVAESTIDNQIVEDNFRYTPSYLKYTLDSKGYTCLKL